MNQFYAFLKSISFIFLLIIATITRSDASHMMGVDINYECIGPNQYLVTLHAYRDVTGIPLVLMQSVRYQSSSCGVNATVQLNHVGGPIPINPSAGCGITPALEMEEYIFEGILILPDGCGPDWVLSWEWCCRNEAITNLQDPGLQNIYVETTLDNTLATCNNSVIFSNQPAIQACLNEPFTYNLGAVDPDGDDLVFSLVNCQEGPGDPVQYFGPFNGSFPLIGAPPAIIDASTGLLTFTPTVQLVPVICVRVEEFRAGVKIGEVNRDIQIAIVDCGDVNQPEVSCFNGSDPADPNNCILATCIGSETCFTINGSDIDSGDNLEMSWDNAISGASFSVTGNGTPNPVATICWIPQPGEDGLHFFNIKLIDNSCPVNQFQYRSFTVDVSATANTLTIDPVAPVCPGESAQLNATTSGATSYNWSPSASLSQADIEDPVATPLVPTLYTLTSTFPDGCALTRTVFVDIAEMPVVSVSPSSSFGCGLAPVSLTATASSAAGITAYIWSNGLTSPTIIAAPGSTTVFSVTVTDGNGCQAIAAATVTVGASPDCPIIYAGPGIAPGSGSGTSTDPYNLVDAINLGSCSGSTIRLLTGEFVLNNPLELQNNITLDGGFNASGVKTSLPGATTLRRSVMNPDIQNGNPHIIALRGTNHSNFRLQDLTITTDNAPAQSRMSMYGVYLNGCADYDLVRVQVLPGSGGSGADGQTGADGDDGNPGNPGGLGDCDGTECLIGSGEVGGIGGSGGTGGGGVNGGMSGLAGNTGQFRNGGGGGSGGKGSDECTSNNDSGGCGGGSGQNTPNAMGNNCVNGGAGSNGNPGGNGQPGGTGNPGFSPLGPAAPGASGFLVNGFWSPGVQGDTGANATGGQGGRGGGGGGRQTGGVLVNNGPGNGGGGGGGGGQGGEGGTGGLGGGASYGVFLTLNGPNGSLSQCRVIAGAGGAGGQGAAGGMGGLGGPGGPGGLECCDGNPNDDNDVGCGGIGGAGGNGGNGQRGGDGADGISQSLALISGISLNNTSTTFNLPGQATITWDGTACTNTPVALTGPGVASPQTFPTTNGTAREDISGTSGLYEGFIDIITNSFVPDAVADNGLLSDDVYRICEGETLNFSTLNAAQGYAFNWTFIEPIGVDEVNPDITGSPTASAVAGVTFNVAGTYFVEVRYTTVCCGLSAPDLITVEVQPQPVINISDETICAEDQNGVMLSANGTMSFGQAFPGGTTDNWTYSWSPAIGLNTTTGEMVIATPANTTNYTLTATNSSGTCSDVAQVTVNVQELQVGLFNPVPDACDGAGVLQAVPPGPVNNYSFSWSDENGNLIGNTVILLGLTGGNYNLTVVDLITDCQFTGGIAVASLGVIGFVSNITEPTCPLFSDGLASVSATGGTNYNYAWPASTGTQITATATGLSPGSYEVTIVDQNNPSCLDVVSVTMPQPPQLTVGFSNIVDANCPTDGAVTAVADSGSGQYQFSWSNGGNGPTISNLAAGPYTVTVLDLVNPTCTTTAIHTVNDNTMLAPVPPGTGVSNELNFSTGCNCANLAVNGGAPFIQQVNNDCAPAGSIISALINKPVDGINGISTDLTKAPCTGTLDLSQNPVYYTVLTDNDGVNNESLFIDVNPPTTGNITGFQATIYGPVNPTNPQFSGGAFLDCNSSTNVTAPLKLRLIGTVNDGEVYIVVVDTDGTGTFTIEGRQGSSALPVELVSFTGEGMEDGTNELRWITETEINTAFFEVERSKEGEVFEQTGATVPAAGNSELRNKYKLIDELPFFGVNYYRLKIVDFDGDLTYSDVITIERKADQEFGLVEILPNPTPGDLTVYFSSPGWNKVSYEVIDILGRQVLNGEVEADPGLNILKIDLQKQENAAYIIKLKLGAQSLIRKIVKVGP